MPSHNPRTFSATPNLAAQKAQVQRSATAKQRNVIYTADEIRTKFKVNDPIRQAYGLGGDPAVRRYLAQHQP